MNDPILKLPGGILGGGVVNRYAQFNGTDAFATIPATTHSIASGTFLARVKLDVATPPTAATSGLFAWSSAGFGSHYPLNTGGIYETCFRTSRVGPITPSASVTRTIWHWVIVRDDAANGWEMLQATDDGTLYSIATTSHEAWAAGPADRLIGKQKNGYFFKGAFDTFAITGLRWSDMQIQAAILANTWQADTLVRYDFNSIVGGKFLDMSGNGKDATITGSPVIMDF